MPPFIVEYERNMVGEFGKLNGADEQEVKEIVANFHFCDGVKHDDGSMGTIKITPGQLRNALAYAMRYAYDQVCR